MQQGENKMIRIKRCVNDRKRLVLQVGKKIWHISYQEALKLKNDLKRELKIRPICPYCKIGKLYIAQTDKKGNVVQARCIVCTKKFKIKDLRR